MANKKFWLGILVTALVFGMTVVGCDDGSTDNNGGSGDYNGSDNSGSPPSAPHNVSAVALSSTSIRVTWTGPSNPAASSFTLYQLTSLGQVVNYWDNIPGSSPVYIVTGLSPYSIYWFCVSAKNSYGESPRSNVVTGSTPSN